MFKDVVEEFKKFAIKGNAIDLAVGVVIGGAFGKIVTSLVQDIIMPAVGLLLGKVNFKTLSLTVTSIDGSEIVLKYGQFIQSVVDFIIISFSIFLFVKLINSFKKKEEEKPKVEEPSKEEKLLTEIRDILKESR
ncbi:large-conductance mechanosensitive channel protein MscL [Clostridium tetani]|uniref:Large-conductance mechanosensitive channel n=1 Tax=Clostridium tetani TaxID=1513 RepID=A0ABY0ESX2_CLOTA|nr:large-conductance mechanosensitive channel protein MscL [Clostridium tetani]CDI48490.1 large-conductance mechanosensitive channel [Clostridium tetani 12124569]KHO40234.1 mechanosensitive ion channel protein MscL [Clostridium tetani]RXI40927.1 large conductance mechanosensitive channel protein MscL [Clostridium tetani]RXI58656.1 large conductance mechanosensitive channel protein MscL [Clostridium tetani]RXI73369.1 large conductance mechanosensitive channel protein MscL [Clostridium tetani]